MCFNEQISIIAFTIGIIYSLIFYRKKLYNDAALLFAISFMQLGNILVIEH